MKWSFTYLLSSFFLLLTANNVQVSNVRLTGRDTVANTVYVTFDISWDNSWRRDSQPTGPKNWDAVWVFAKVRAQYWTDNRWDHVYFNFVDGTGAGDGHLYPNTCVIRSSNDNGAGKSYGVFIYSSKNIEPQSVSYSNIRLLWNYGDQGFLDWDSVEICVFAIEMVYIPMGSFYVGDGSLNWAGNFEAGNTNSPFRIVSEGAITLGGTANTNLSNHNNANMFNPDDFSYSTTRTLPAAFPKGYNHFYIMKYEITQEQYVAFMNKLSKNQAVNYGNRILTGSSYRLAIGGSWPNYTTSRPYVACNYLSYADVAAYLDWAALRPISELEFEKAARAPYPYYNQDEYAWGGATYLVGATGILNDGAGNEMPSNADANCNYGNSLNGPLRVGCFGYASNRHRNDSLGASYWGVFELSGNVAELVISVGQSAGRNFSGIPGDGYITSTNGDANVPGWGGYGYRGGDWYNNQQRLRVSDRYYVNNVVGRSYWTGGRGGRSMHPVLP